MTPLQHETLVSMDKRLTGIEKALSQAVAVINGMPHIVISEDGKIEFIGASDTTRPLLKELFDTRLKDSLKEYQMRLSAATNRMNMVQKQLEEEGSHAVTSMQKDADDRVTAMEDDLKAIVLKAETELGEIKNKAEGIARSAMVIGNAAKMKAGVQSTGSFYRDR